MCVCAAWGNIFLNEHIPSRRPHPKSLNQQRTYGRWCDGRSGGTRPLGASPLGKNRLRNEAVKVPYGGNSHKLWERVFVCVCRVEQYTHMKMKSAQRVLALTRYLCTDLLRRLHHRHHHHYQQQHDNDKQRRICKMAATVRLSALGAGTGGDVVMTTSPQRRMPLKIASQLNTLFVS